jgi:alanine racemase
MFREFRLWMLRRKARKVQAIAIRLDAAMQKMGLSRAQRRQMWREIIKSPDVRKEAFGSFTGE